MPNVDIPQGSIGVITAKDGLPLPDGEIYAPAWEDTSLISDGLAFLTDKKGYKGPQLTVLSPGVYPYNPELFQIDIKPMLEVKVGEVAVIKANAGAQYVPNDGEEVVMVNGTPIVPQGFRGIWTTALTPNAYYLHPGAYMVTRVQTTNQFIIMLVSRPLPYELRMVLNSPLMSGYR